MGCLKPRTVERGAVSSTWSDVPEDHSVKRGLCLSILMKTRRCRNRRAVIARYSWV